MTPGGSSGWRVLFSVPVIFVLAAVPAAAQDPGARRISVGASAGVATPLHGDFDFTAGSWQADVRFEPARHFAVSVFFEEWRHSEEETFGPHDITGPAGILGRVDRVATRTDHRTRALGWNGLATGAAQRVTVSGGGGISYLLYTRDFTQTMTGCAPTSLCRDFSQQFDNSSFAAQVQAGVDVALTQHVAVMGQFRLLLPLADPGGGHHSVTGGVRFAF
jgi:hypothetical protein